MVALLQTHPLDKSQEILLLLELLLFCTSASLLASSQFWQQVGYPQGQARQWHRQECFVLDHKILMP